MNPIQSLIDNLAQRLDRPVGLDDRRFRAIAYSSHADEIDAVRRRSILGRQAPDAVIDWLEGLGLMRARDVVRVPANAGLEMVARISVPVRFHDRLLGFLWLVDEDGALTDGELETCRRTAEELAHELYRERQQTNEERRQETQWVRQAVRPQPGQPDPRTPGIAADAVYAALVVRVGFPAGAVIPAGVDVRLVEAVDQVRRGVAPRHQLAAVGDAEATVVVSAGGASEVERHAAALLAACESELDDLPGASVVVGAGDVVDAIGELPGSAAGAVRAAQLGETMPELGSLVRWPALGVVRLLSEMVGDRDPAAFVPESLRRLLADADSERLVSSVEAYLEHGGDVAAAAADLFVHRSSLYNRLRRVEEVAGIELRSGAHRLELHLGLRLWRMGRATVAAPGSGRVGYNGRRSIGEPLRVDR